MSIAKSNHCQNGLASLARDEREVDLVDAVAPPQVDEEVSEDQHNEDDA
ncbi:hypothetical protein [Demequina litorisediminis]